MGDGYKSLAKALILHPVQRKAAGEGGGRIDHGIVKSGGTGAFLRGSSGVVHHKGHGTVYCVFTHDSFLFSL